ncbi:MAG: acyl-[acyl-carrier-protein] thioesterase, partial [Lachnospiraceae bacterium]
EKYVLGLKLDMEYAPRKILIPENGVAQDSFTVQRQHLDSNHHVNNAQYVKMAVPYLPEDFRTGQLRVEYKSQAHLNDVICPMVAVNGTVHTVWLNSPEGMTYAVLEFTQK